MTSLALSPAEPRPADMAMIVRIIAAMAVLMSATVWGRYEAGAAMPLLAIDVAVGVVCCALVPVLLRKPVLGAVGMAVLAAVSWAATPAATLGTVYVARQRRFPAAVVVGIIGVAAHVLRGLWQPIDGLPIGWWILLVVLGEAALVAGGALTQARHALISSLRERAQRAEDEQGRRVAEARTAERRRIAGEMHDVLAHRLSLVATYAGALEYRPDSAPERLSKAAAVIRTGVHDALGELRDVIAVLREDENSGSISGPQPGLADVPALIEESRQAGMVVHLRDSVTELEAAPATAGRTTYRIVREALTNARKHAADQPVHVTLSGAPQLGLTIEVSNPLPAPAAPLVPGSGTGLIGLTERARLAGGSLDHYTGDGEFRLRSWLPWTG
ncbi:sensor histidine kinase [Sciscionella marina]|uniref:sensor histidine kinase n=1 Tax=Sciscionella marina TaxID=508770 RepID=UPI00058F3A3C|nr:histidine kinase [Sciscionella marina]